MVAANYSCQLGKATGSAVRTLVGRNAPATNIRAQLPLAVSRLPTSASASASASASTSTSTTHAGAARCFSISAACALNGKRRSGSDVGPSRSVRSAIDPEALKLKPDLPDAAPTLEHLDSLKPTHQQQQRGRRSGARSSPAHPFGQPDDRYDNHEARLWQKTRDALNASFTRDQLLALAKEAGLRGGYSSKIKKEELIKRIMLHRFGMEDIEAKQERLRNEERDKVNLFLPFEPAQLFLLLANGAAAVRSEASKRQVNVLPQPPLDSGAPSNGLGFWVRGKPDDTVSMRQWAEEFKTTIVEKLDHVHLPALSASSSDAGIHLAPSLLQFISRSSRCFIEVLPSSSTTVLDLRLRYLEASDAERATSMLRHFISQRRSASQRLSSAIYPDAVSALHQYTLLPFAPSQPLPWICQAEDAVRNTQGGLTFRASVIHDFATVATTPASGAAAEAAPRIRAWGDRGEVETCDPFQSLLDLSTRAVAGGEVADVEQTFTATLGHVLFLESPSALAAEVAAAEAEDLGQGADDAAAEDPLASPRPGLWPLEHLIEYLVKMRRGAGCEAEGKRFVETTLLRTHKGESTAAWLDRHGWRCAPRAEEVRVLSYTDESAAEHGGRTLHAELRFDGGVDKVAWRGRGETDVMVPAQPFDLRLEATSDLALPTGLERCEKLLEFAQKVKEEPGLSPPSRIQLSIDGDNHQGSTQKTLVLESSARIVRRTWTRGNAASAAPALPKAAVEADTVEGADEEEQGAATQDMTGSVELLHEMLGEEDGNGARETMKIRWMHTPPSWETVSSTLSTLLPRFK